MLRASSTSPEPKRAEAPYFERAARAISSSATPPSVCSAKICAEGHYARRFLDFRAWSFFEPFPYPLTLPLTVRVGCAAKGSSRIVPRAVLASAEITRPETRCFGRSVRARSLMPDSSPHYRRGGRYGIFLLKTVTLTSKRIRRWGKQWGILALGSISHIAVDHKLVVTLRRSYQRRCHGGEPRAEPIRLGETS